MNTNNEFFKSAINTGLIMAGGFILIDLLFYIVDMTGLGMMFGFLVLLIIIALFFIFFIWGGRTYRNKFMDGHIKYSKAFLFCMVMAAVYIVIMFIYQFLFYNFFDPTRVAMELQKQVEMIQNNSYIPDDQKEIQINKIMENSSAFHLMIVKLINNSISCIVLGAISALFIRKKEKISEVF